ncbi:Hypothetical protein HVR_LOCUS156 [uncultured virus]|nr:Hypothetical protein HVR_LOCUS156 [uncultured virus]
MDDWQLAPSNNIILIIVIILVIIGVIILLVVIFNSGNSPTSNNTNSSSNSQNNDDDEEDDGAFDATSEKASSNSKSNHKSGAGKSGKSTIKPVNNLTPSKQNEQSKPAPVSNVAPVVPTEIKPINPPKPTVSEPNVLVSIPQPATVIEHPVPAQAVITLPNPVQVTTTPLVVSAGDDNTPSSISSRDHGSESGSLPSSISSDNHRSQNDSSIPSDCPDDNKKRNLLSHDKKGNTSEKWSQSRVVSVTDEILSIDELAREQSLASVEEIITSAPSKFSEPSASSESDIIVSSGSNNSDAARPSSPNGSLESSLIKPSSISEIPKNNIKQQINPDKQTKSNSTSSDKQIKSSSTSSDKQIKSSSTSSDKQIKSSSTNSDKQNKSSSTSSDKQTTGNSTSSDKPTIPVVSAITQTRVVSHTVPQIPKVTAKSNPHPVDETSGLSMDQSVSDPASLSSDFSSQTEQSLRPVRRRNNRSNPLAGLTGKVQNSINNVRMGPFM